MLRAGGDRRDGCGAMPHADFSGCFRQIMEAVAERHCLWPEDGNANPGPDTQAKSEDSSLKVPPWECKVKVLTC